jgi:HK97 family phage major capsid protein
MEIREMNIEQVEERKASILVEMENEGANLDALEEEMRSLNTRANEIKADASAKAEEARKVADGDGDLINTIIKEDTRNMMDVKEYRNSVEYMNAFAEYIKTGKDEECRALLTTNVGSGTIAVPDFVLDEVKTAWDKNEIMSRVNKVSLTGNLKVNFEISGTDAVAHTEGSAAVAEETLVEGIATITPIMYKKWIGISDEVMSMRGEAFLRYIYAELTHKIVKKMADDLVAKIAALPAVATSTSPNAVTVQAEPAVGTVAEAIANLSDEASSPVVIMNKLTWALFKVAQYNNNYGVDPFEGLAVMFNSSLPAFGSADEGDVYMIVGDLGQGAIANFPNGDSIEFIFDELSRKKEDMVEVLGREYAGIGVVACKAFTLVAKPELD